MRFNPQIHRQNSLQLKGYDYTNPRAYFITLVAYDRTNLFGEITEGVMCLTHVGEIVHASWLRLSDYFPIKHDEWVIMPNHMHAILWILDLEMDGSSSGQEDWFPWRSLADASPRHHTSGTQSESLGAIVKNFKSVTARKINQKGIDTSVNRDNGVSNAGLAFASLKIGAYIWQRNYYEHVIRDQNELKGFRRYITEDPHQWSNDQENPHRSTQ